MTLIDDVRAICTRLAPHGWSALLAAHGLDIGAADLAAELARPLPGIDRSQAGFEEFAREGGRGIEPGHPARSLLFHALASPSVMGPSAFPTPAELDTVENYVYAAGRRSLAEVLAAAAPADVGIVVFAAQYRPAEQTPHGRHADVCHARTGIARIGTAPPRWDGRLRGFAPAVDGDPHAIAVLPARYAAYLAMRVAGSADGPGGSGPVPMRHRDGDADRQFWLPVHKLFPGDECLRGLDLHVTLSASHVNEKLRRVHAAFGADASWFPPDTDGPPFRFTDGIAELSVDADLGPGTVVPVTHRRLVEAATFRGEPLTFRVPPNEPLSSSLSIPAVGLRRPAPEYVHARHQVTAAGAEVDLNTRADVVDVVAAGGYRARHYVDFTGDGWVSAVVPELAVELPRRRSAYSVVAAPDFFPTTDQRELTEWTARRLPTALREAIWRVPPDPLSDERFPPNLQLAGAGFRADDDTVTAIVAAPVPGGRAPGRLVEPPAERCTFLPDDAAGVFAPGWDVSVDGIGDGPDHLAAHGLGSPFPEDAKLCAALSSFWPAVAPDAARTFEPSPNWPTVAPLTDAEIGSFGDLPWDGVPGPRRVDAGGEQVVEYRDLAHADYVQNCLDNRFTMALTGRIDDREYQARVLAMVRVYAALGVDLDAGFGQVVRGKARWTVVSFRAVDPTADDAEQARKDTGVVLGEPLYRFEVVERGAVRPAPGAVGRVHMRIRRAVTLLADPVSVLGREGDGPWEQLG
jgi:hypothetical protein